MWVTIFGGLLTFIATIVTCVIYVNGIEKRAIERDASYDKRIDIHRSVLDVHGVKIDELKELKANQTTLENEVKHLRNERTILLMKLQHELGINIDITSTGL